MYFPFKNNNQLTRARKPRIHHLSLCLMAVRCLDNPTRLLSFFRGSESSISLTCPFKDLSKMGCGRHNTFPWQQGRFLMGHVLGKGGLKKKQPELGIPNLFWTIFGYWLSELSNSPHPPILIGATNEVPKYGTKTVGYTQIWHFPFYFYFTQNIYIYIMTEMLHDGLCIRGITVRCKGDVTCYRLVERYQCSVSLSTQYKYHGMLRKLGIQSKYCMSNRRCRKDPRTKSRTRVVPV